MSLLVGTRKGLFTLERGPTAWQIEHVDFLGEPVTTGTAVRSTLLNRLHGGERLEQAALAPA